MSTLLNRVEVCELLRISMPTLSRLRSRHDFPRGSRIGRQMRWDAETIRRWVESGGCSEPERTEELVSA